MKKILLYSLLVTLFVSCTSNENIPEFKYQYKIIPIPYGKYVAERGFETNKIYGTLAFNYTIDTLEIKLNSGNTGSLRIKANTYTNPNTSSPQNKPPHINYLYFSDLKPNWNDNNIKKIFFDENNSGGQYTTFSYSKCNIDLSQRPELFVLNPHRPDYATLEMKDKKIFTQRLYYSNNELSIGEVFLYGTFYVKVLQKKEL